MKYLALPCFLLLFALHFTYAQSLLFSGMQPGPFPVGFKVEYQYDHGRSFRPKYDYYGHSVEGNTARLMQIAVWYPAELKKGLQYLSLADYAQLALQEDDPKPLDGNQQAALQDELNAFQWKNSGLRELITTAIKNGEAKEGKYPLILYAPSLSASVAENQVLCEYLAGQGYIVASVPAKGAYSNEMQSADLESIDAQVQDLEYLLGFMQDYPNVDFSKIGVVGYSIGGLSNVILALKNYHIDAVVSLDGSIASIGYLGLMKDQYYFDPTRMRAAFMQMSKNKENPAQNPSTFLDAACFTDTYLLRFAGLQHQDFSSSSILFNYVFNEKDPDNPAISAYPLQCRYVSAFMNAYLKEQKDAMRLLKNNPAENGLDSHFVSTRLRQGRRIPPTKGQFVGMIRNQGIDQAIRVWKDVEKNTPEVSILDSMDWRVLLEEGLSLMADENYEAAVKAFNLNLSVYPDWYLTHFELAKAWQALGNSQKMHSHLTACLRFHPLYEPALNLLSKEEWDNPASNWSCGDCVSYLGTYAHSGQPESGIRLFKQDGKLFYVFIRDGNEYELLPDSKDRFLLTGVNAQFFFEFAPDGSVRGMRMLGLNSGRLGKVRWKQ